MARNVLLLVMVPWDLVTLSLHCVILVQIKLAKKAKIQLANYKIAWQKSMEGTEIQSSH
jgi:hypothetical protein